jgi:GT2 family glycosyltransferase
VVFLVANPDALPPPDYLARATAALAGGERRASVQGKLLRTGPGQLIDTTGHLAFRTRLFRNRGEGQPDTGQYDTPGEVFGTSGALALYRMAALQDVAVDGEVFDETLFAFWEDVDLDWRMALRGWSAWYAPEATARHERGGAGPRRSAIVERLNFVNRFHVILKNDDPAALARALPEVGLTSLLKAGELALTVPSAFVRTFGAWRDVPAVLRKRRAVQTAATVAPAEVVRRWFQPFDYGLWVRTWWRRVHR